MDANNCFKVIVVEDESIILENIIEKINALNYPFQIVASATNGEDALSHITKLKPDVLFTDIKMPIMNGLELIKEARILIPNLKVIVISGYNDFDYAQEAIRSGAFDYLLKPVNINNLKNTLDRLYGSLKELTNKYEREIILSSLQEGSLLPELPCGLCDCHFSLYLITLKNLYTNCHELLDIAEINALWKSLDLPIKLSDILPPLTKWWLIGEKYPNGKMLIIASSLSKNYHDKIFYTLTSQTLCSITLCYTDKAIPFTNIWRVSQSLRASLTYNLRPYRDGLIPFYEGEETTHVLNEIHLLDDTFISSCDLYIKSGHIDCLELAFAGLFDTWQQQHLPQYYLEKYFLQIITAVVSSNPLLKINYATICGEFYQALTAHSTEEGFYLNLKSIINKHVILVFKTCDSRELLYHSLKDYMDENFSKPITLESLSKTFNFSCSYMTRIFKHYHGQPPVKYLLSLRINEAKRLIILYPNMSFKLIAEMVGYDDAHYFSRLFKASTGLTPSEYKQNF